MVQGLNPGRIKRFSLPEAFQTVTVANQHPIQCKPVLGEKAAGA
jgi:hypothetical protein